MPENAKGSLRRDFLLGFGVSQFLLWFPLVLPRALEDGSEMQTSGLSGLIGALIILGGFSCAFAVDRFTAQKARFRRRLQAGVCLLILTLLLTFGDWPLPVNLLFVLLSSLFVSILTLTLTARVPDANSAGRVFCFLGLFGGLFLSAGRVMAEVLGTHVLLRVLCAGLLLTAGLLCSHLTAKEEHTAENFPSLDAAPPRRASLRACCVGVFLLCAADAFLGIRMYFHTALWDMTVPYELIVPTLLSVVMAVLLSLLPEAHRWLLGVIALSGLSAGAVLLFAPAEFSLTPYASAFLFLCAFASLCLLFVFRLYYASAAPNRKFTLGFCFLVLFLTVWLFCRPGLISWLAAHLTSQRVDIVTLIAMLPLLSFLILVAYKPRPTQKTDEEPAQEPAPETSEAPVPHSQPVSEAPDAPPPPQTAETPSPSPVIHTLSQDVLFTQLTMTEKKVYELILGGYSNQQMADILYVSINTIKFHIKNILSKAGASKKSQLVSRFIHAPGSLPSRMPPTAE
ncbi:MAG: LuxR C-terminal-related transcriptional regulator [Oscillospiraceae bacterium]|jgi:DNA-binding CsgD family transcriptional regulator|nr:LuxR C-terminal-related transcriptional regulator [Oscillospiraceae bacterium]